MFSAEGVRNLLASPVPDGQIPIAEISAPKPGNYLITMERNPSVITLAAKKFTAYLQEEGLDEIARQRKQSSEQGKPGRERYSRYLKSLVEVGGQRDDAFRRVVGHRLEIVPEANPYELKQGDLLRVRVLFEGQPLKGVRVFAHNKERGAIRSQATATTDDGAASFTLNGSGRWLIRLVHMRRCRTDCSDVDWESFWTSYSFGMK